MGLGGGLDSWGSHRVVRRKGLLSERAESKKGCGCLVAHMTPSLCLRSETAKIA